MSDSSGMSKMLEDDIRAQNVLLKALKERLAANLERLKVMANGKDRYKSDDIDIHCLFLGGRSHAFAYV